MALDGEQSLRQAIARNVGLVLSLPSAGMLRHHKSRFLADSGDSFWIESAPSDRRLIDALIAAQGPVGIAYRKQSGKVVFATLLLQRQDEYRVSADTLVEALRVEFPEQVKTIQRRAHYRVRLGSDSDISVRAWRIAETWPLADKPASAAEVPVRIRDLSAGGVGLLWGPGSGASLKLLCDERLRVVLKRGDQEILLEGRVRFMRTLPNGAVHVGVRFEKLEDTLDGRQAITRLTNLVGDLQRDELRRLHLGMNA
jgi:c-di-GMP-binding flagellar brake protein YcgR